MWNLWMQRANFTWLEFLDDWDGHRWVLTLPLYVAYCFLQMVVCLVVYPCCCHIELLLPPAFLCLFSSPLRPFSTCPSVPTPISVKIQDVGKVSPSPLTTIHLPSHRVWLWVHSLHVFLLRWTSPLTLLSHPLRSLSALPLGPSQCSTDPWTCENSFDDLPSALEEVHTELGRPVLGWPNGHLAFSIGRDGQTWMTFMANPVNSMRKTEWFLL